ncbi:InlB B-repeat-containing protein, partial [bacterium]|nr:InlB B-repeat-containing protein [bacterium]
MKILEKRQSVFKSYRKRVFLICIALATLLLGVGYAQLTQQTLFINADANNTPLEDVVITSVASGNNVSVPTYTSNSVNSTVTLNNSNPADTASMTITVYNNSDTNQYFLGASHESGMGYTNSGIVYTISGIDDEELIEPGESKTFTVTFSYKDGQLQSSNTLTSFIQYNFSPLDSMTFTANNSPSATYTGAALTPSGVTVSSPNSGVTVMYGTTDGVYDSSSVPTFTNAGTHTIYYQIKADGYLTETGSYTFTIDKATPVITLSEPNGSVVEGSTTTFTATVASGASNGNAAGTLSAISSDTSVVTVSPESSNVTATTVGVTTTEIITGVTSGTSTITVGFTPTDTDNYNTPTSVTYTVTILDSATIPTDTLCVDRTYTGAAQDLTSVTSGAGYTLSGYSQTNAGEYRITATLITGYAWSDNTTGTKTFACTMSKATPVITLSASSGEVGIGETSNLIVTVSSGGPATAAGVLSSSSNYPSYAVVSPESTNITANTSGIATTETITGIATRSNITLSFAFTPTDTTNFNGPITATYNVAVKICLRGDTLANCLIYTYGGRTRNYNEAITNIKSKEDIDFRIPEHLNAGMHAIPDYSSISATTLDGTSYYLRGGNMGNYVDFAGYTWRVLRINGDGSIRLVSDNTIGNSNSAYNSNNSGSQYVGYTYDDNGVETDSTIKSIVDNWYATNIKPIYEGYLSNQIFCNDRSIISTSGNNINYGAYLRLVTYDAPSLFCSNQADKYTLKESGYSSIAGTNGAGNNLLDYPIGLVTADEVVISGGAYEQDNNTQDYWYLMGDYWTETPYGYISGTSRVFDLYGANELGEHSVSWSNGVQPVINLRPDVKYNSGTGGGSSKYTIILEPSLALNSYKGSVSPNGTTTITATIYSGIDSNILGTLTVSSSDTSKATVSPGSSNVTATPSGTAVTITVTGVALGSSTITVGFTPADTSTYGTPDSKTYIVTTRDEYTINFDANGGTFSNNNSINTLIFPNPLVITNGLAQHSGTYSEPIKAGYTFYGWVSSENGYLYSDLSEESLLPTDDVTYTAQWGQSVTIPVAEDYCRTGLVYTGSSQVLTNAPGTGYSFSGTTGTLAGNHTVVATLDDGYIWSDGSREQKFFKCEIGRATPVMTVNSTGWTINSDGTMTFDVTVASGLSDSRVSGYLNVSSGDISAATVSPTSTYLTATPSGTSVTITVTGAGSIKSKTTTITISFSPNYDYYPEEYNYRGINFNTPASQAYTLLVQAPTQCVAGDTLSNCLLYADTGTRNYSDAITNINNKTASNFSSTATTYEGLKAIADYSSVSSTSLDGTSYYYRGNIDDNWVSFAGYLWRVVRINGDGSVRMVYSGTVGNHTGTGTQIGTSVFNSSVNDAKYIGYMYDTDSNSTIKNVIDTWYENNLKIGYEGYLANEIFCNDRSISSTGSYTYYGAYGRYNTTKIPSLECVNSSDRFTLKESGKSEVQGVGGAGNNLLDYPIGLLSIDEIWMAGSKANTGNSQYYLYTGQSYWSNSPWYSYSSGVEIFDTGSSGYYWHNSANAATEGVRPVINLKSTVQYSSGSGLDFDPYIIKQKPYIKLNESNGGVSLNSTRSFVITVYSGGVLDVSGILTVSSSDVSKATVSLSNNNITATQNGTSATVTVTGVDFGSSVITVSFAPTDIASYDNPESKTYAVTVINNYTVTFDANGGEFSNNASINTLVYPLNYLTSTTETITKYSHTENVDDTGLQISNYGDNWTNANITGTDRGDTSKPHVVTIPGAHSMIIDIYYNGESISNDWASVWEGAHQNYNATSYYSSSGKLTPNDSNYSKFGGPQSGNYTVNGNSLTNMGYSTFVIYSDTVTFDFRSNGSGYGDGYGYYAIVTGQRDVESIAYSGTYSEPTRTGYDFVGWLSSKDGIIYHDISGESLRPNDDITYTAQWGHYVAIPTAADYCRTGLSYTGSGQTITNVPATGYSFSNNTPTDAGSHTVIATLDTDYVWTDNTFGTKTFSCSISKVTPVITLSSASGVVVVDNTTTFDAVVTSSVNSAGTLTVTSGATSVATVMPASTSLTATSAGISTTETITGVSKGSGTITVSFTPTDTTNFNIATNKTYSFSAEGVNQCVSGDTLANCLLYNDYGGRNYSDAVTAIGNKIASSFSSISETYEGLKAISDYSSVSATSLDGTSYYYRGAILDNWVSFAGFLWRVVRINGDGSVRMIYSGTTSNHTGTGTRISQTYFNSNSNNSKYIGYTYDTSTNSTIKTTIDNWYVNNLKANYENYLSNEIFCNDRTSTGSNTIYYGAYTRLVNNKAPSLLCTNQADRYTLKESGLSSIPGTNGAGNNKLNYPIGLLTADEVAMAGGKSGTSNTSYYLYTGQDYWLGSPYRIYSSRAYGFYINTSGNFTTSSVATSYGVRPVINLKPSVKYASGSGTESNPYVVQEIPTPTITLSSASGNVDTGDTTTFTATVTSSNSSNIAGTLTVVSGDTSKATVSPASTNVTATQAGVATTITVTGVADGTSTITVSFTPTDTSYYSSAADVSYTATVTTTPTLAEKLIMDDQGASSYSDSLKTAIQNKTARDFSTTATTDEGLHAIADYSSVSATTLDGTSYYYRGAVEDNWVSFAGFYWRIVRINGDGSVRMIYSGTAGNHTGSGATLGYGGYVNTFSDDPKYVGYVYDIDTDSGIKTGIDMWYENNLKANYEGYLSNEIFCNDRSIGGTTNYYGDTYYDFGAYTRLVTNKTPSLLCTNQADRFTLKVSGSSSIAGINGAGNNLLDYPIGLLTADEVSLAGGVAYNFANQSSSDNSSYYLYLGTAYWLMSPGHNDPDGDSVLIVDGWGSFMDLLVFDYANLRPVINLKPSVKWNGGDGT